MKDIEKAVSLALIDENWKEHLRSMDELKDSVQSASFEQKDPLVIYKMEAYQSFEQLVYRINFDVISYLMGGKLLIGAPEDVREAKANRTDFRRVQTSRQDEARQRAAASAGREEQNRPETFKRAEKKIKRNDPCPCGSGKKYKNVMGHSQRHYILMTLAGVIVNLFLVRSHVAAQVSLVEEVAVSKMMTQYKSTNFKTPMIRAWRIQIITTNDRKTMESALEDFEELYPDINYKWEHNPPYYQVRIGAFERKADLEGFMVKLKEDFPAAIPVQDDIEKKEIIMYK